MATVEQKQRILKAQVALALYGVLGRVPKDKELNQVSMLTCMLCKAVPGLHYQRQAQKKRGQLAF